AQLSEILRRTDGGESGRGAARHAGPAIRGPFLHRLGRAGGPLLSRPSDDGGGDDQVPEPGTARRFTAPGAAPLAARRVRNDQSGTGHFRPESWDWRQSGQSERRTPHRAGPAERTAFAGRLAGDLRLAPRTDPRFQRRAPLARGLSRGGPGAEA